MGLTEIFLIAIGLSMDAFAVSISLGLSLGKPKLKEMIIPGLYFGGFQAAMPIAGYFSGVYFAHQIKAFAPWVALSLLGIIGGKMIKESFSENEEAKEYSLRFARMLVLAFATSIDALAVGITFSFFEVSIFSAASIIGLVTGLVSLLGVKIGHTVGTRFQSKAEFTGGLILVLLGIKIVLEHLFSAS